MAAWSADLLEDALLARRLLNIPIVFFRNKNGEPRALHDRCPHRFAPLSKGKLKDDSIECGYHGLCFAETGKCVGNPFQRTLPAAAHVRTFPILEQDSIIWIWLGDATKANPSGISRFNFHVDNGYRNVFGYSHQNANYELNGT
jgi:vanillate O-demethylase monooxygenase subunit